MPELAALADVIPDRLILDAELVCLNAAGQPDFARLRRRLVAGTCAAVEDAAAAAPVSGHSDVVRSHGVVAERRGMRATTDA